MFKKSVFVLSTLVIVLWNTKVFSQDMDSLANAFGHIPDFTGIQISPDGDRIATLMNYQGQRLLVTRSLVDPNAEPSGIPFNEGEFRWVRWVNNDKLIAGVEYTAKIRQNKTLRRSSRGGVVQFLTTRLVSMDWNGDNQQLLTQQVQRRRFQPQFQDRIIDYLPDDPEHVLLSLDREKQNQPSVYRLNVNTNDRSLVHDDRQDIRSWRTDHNHQVRLGFGRDYTSAKDETEIFAIYRKSVDDDWTTLYRYNSQIEDPPFEFLGFSDDPDFIYVRQFAASGYRGIYKFNVDTNEVVETIAESDEYDLRSIYQDDEGQLTGYTYRAHIIKRVSLNDTGQKINRIFETNFPGAEFLISSKSKDGQRLIVRTESSVDPGSYYLVDLNENKVELLDYNYKMIEPSMLSESKPVKYMASDGIEINGYLTLPSSAHAKENLPTVILPVWRQGNRFYQDFHFWTQFFAANGYAVLQINYRGAGGYGQFYQNLGRGEMGRRIIQDVTEGTRWMIDNGYSDPSKICIAGDTFGGYIALQAPSAAPGLYACSIAHAPVTSLNSYFRFMKDFVEYDHRRQLVHNGEWDLDDASPLFNIDNMTIPVILFHGEKDASISVKESRDYYKRMQRAEKDVVYFEFEDADAYLSRQEHRVKFLKESGLFLAKHLK